MQTSPDLLSEQHLKRKRASFGLLPVDGFVRQTELLTIIPISRSTLWQMVSEGTFPAPMKLSARISAWRASDVRAFIETRSRHSCAAGAPANHSSKMSDFDNLNGEAK